MHIQRLGLADFRCYPALDLVLEPGISTFVGPNGEGKTNVLEAVGFAARLGSHRVATDAPLVRLGAERAVVRTSVVRDGRSVLVELEINPCRANRARVAGAPVPRAREALGVVRAVLFAPEDLALVKGDPSERRRYLDELLVVRTPRYAGVRADYDRVLKQRNALLKSAGAARRSGGSALHTLDVWDSHLATAGAELLAGRLQLVEALLPLVVKAYPTISRGTGPTGLAYRSFLDDDGDPAGAPGTDRDVLAAALAAAFAGARDQELDRGVTLVG